MREESLVVPGLSRIAVSTHDPLKPIFNQRPQPTLSHRPRLWHILRSVNGVIHTVNVEAVTVGGDGPPHNACRRKKEGGRRKKEEGRRKKGEGRRKKEEGRRKKGEGRRKERRRKEV